VFGGLVANDGALQVLTASADPFTTFFIPFSVLVADSA
jgi:hypothetical protein